MRKLILELWCLNDYAADFLVWLAVRISRDKRHEIWRADYTYSTCVDIAKGKYKTLKDARAAAYGSVY